jgi:hypothetical protein
MRVRIALLLGALLMLPVAADAITIRDIIELSKAGLSDELLTAVIDADRTVFTLDKDQILELKKAGVSQAVLLKMLASRREFDRPPAGTPATETVTSEADLPGVVIIGGNAGDEPRGRGERGYRDTGEFGYPFFYMTYPIWGVAPSRGPRPAPAPFLPADQRGFGRFINDGWIGKP